LSSEILDQSRNHFTFKFNPKIQFEEEGRIVGIVRPNKGGWNYTLRDPSGLVHLNLTVKHGKFLGFWPWHDEMGWKLTDKSGNFLAKEDRQGIWGGDGPSFLDENDEIILTSDMGLGNGQKIIKDMNMWKKKLC